MFNIAISVRLLGSQVEGRGKEVFVQEFSYRPPNCWLICLTIWIEVAISRAGLNDHSQLCLEKFWYIELTNKRLSVFSYWKTHYDLSQ